MVGTSNQSDPIAWPNNMKSRDILAPRSRMVNIQMQILGTGWNSSQTNKQTNKQTMDGCVNVLYMYIYIYIYIYV